MQEIIYHSLGLCGEGHLNLVHVSVMAVGVWCAVKLVRSGLARYARIEGTIRG